MSVLTANNYLRIIRFVVITVFAIGFMAGAQAQPLEGDLLGEINPIRIAVPKAKAEGTVPDEGNVTETIHSVLQNDLRLSRNIQKPNYILVPSIVQIESLDVADRQSGRINYGGWSEIGAQYVVKVTVRAPEPELLQLDVFLFDILSQKSLLSQRSGRFPKEHLRRYVHNASDDVVQRTTPSRGIASTQIAFVNQTGNGKEICIMDYDGHEDSVRQLTDFNSISVLPAWSPDADFIAYSSYRDGWCDAYIHSVRRSRGKAYRPLLQLPGNNLGPRWNPADADEMVISLSHKGNAEIFLINTNGEILRRLTNDNAIDTAPVMSPNGTEIAWTSDRTGYPQVYIMDRDGANVRRLTNIRGLRCDSPAWAPPRSGAQDRLAFYAHQGGSIGDIYTILADGSDYQKLTETGPDNASPTWSPDGMYIAYSSTVRGAAQIYLMQYNGDPPPGHDRHLRLTRMQGDCISPVWSPFMQ